MVQLPKNRPAFHMPNFRKFHLPSPWRFLIQPLVSPVFMVIFKKLTNDPASMPLVEDDHVVEAFPLQGADHAFAIPVLPGWVRRSRPVLHSQMVDRSQHLLAIDPVPVPDQVLWRFIRPDSLAGDLSTDPKPATMEANPGTFEIVPDGYEFKAWEPDHPTAQFPAFIKQMLRKIASGFSVFYNVLANDAEGVSYSTMRSFALVERDDWRSIQQDFIDMWRRPLYSAWLSMALLTGTLKLSSRDPSRYLAVRHRPRGWQWIDPEKEAKAAVISIQNGLGTRTGFLAEKGEDIEDVFAELAREEELAQSDLPLK